jgi:tol-pal system protein YbgF
LWMGMCLLGCATRGDIRMVLGEIDRTNSQLNLIQKEIASLQVESGALKGDLGNQTKTLQADFLLRIENLQSEIRILSTDVEEYKELIKRPSKEVDRGKEDSELRLKALEERGKNFEEKIKELEGHPKGLHEKSDRFSSKQMEMEKSIPTKEPLTEVKGISIRAGDLYKDAYETFQKGDLEAALRKFEVFLKQYPNTELSDNAQFWIGETFFLKKDFEKAILEYEKAIAKYPEGDKIAAALFKQALAFLELGDKTNARSLLKKVIERYPHSDQAEMAKKKIETIK